MESAGQHATLPGACLAILLLALGAVDAKGQLAATVTPGATVTNGQPITSALLNAIATPTVSISGGVQATNLTANSITGIQLNDSVPDGITLDYNGSSPRQLEVKAAGVSKTQVATNVIALGLAGGAGTAISVVLDGTNLTVYSNLNNTVTLNTNVWGPVTNCVFGTASGGTNAPLNLQGPLAISGTNLVVTNFTTPLIPLPSGGGVVTNATHGFATGNAPRIVQWVLVNQTGNLFWSPGDEVPVQNFLLQWNQGFLPLFTFGANSNQISLIMINGFNSGHDTWAVDKQGNVQEDVFNAADWKAKGYAFQ